MGNQTSGNTKIAMSKKTSPNISSATAVTIPSKISLPQEWPFRLAGNLFFLVLIFTIASAIITVKTNLIGRKLSDLSSEFFDYTSQIGFTLDDIIVSGRKKTTKEELKQVLQLNRDNNIFTIDLQEIKQRLENLPWIRKAEISRHYFPNILQIELEERKVESIWQINNRFHPIDREGHVINAPYTSPRPILLIVGEGAPENIPQLMQIISQDKEIFSRIKVANYISGRRWNLILDDIENGITIKLPAQGQEEAWKKLIKLNSTQGLLKRKLTIIDLRFPNKVIVKLGKMTKEERERLKEVKESLM